jgi:[ribosomal protein S5]-alanine N-acetyltransferase
MAEPQAEPQLVSIVSPSGRLLLRSPEVTDAAAIVANVMNPENVAFLPHLNHRNHTVERYSELIQQWRMSSLKSDLFLVIVRREDDKIVGDCMFESFRPLGKEWDEGDCGVMIDSAERGKGYAQEALRTLFDFAFGSLGLERLTMSTAEENTPMRGLATKMGLQGHLEPKSTAGRHVVFRLSEEDWCIKHGRVET